MTKRMRDQRGLTVIELLASMAVSGMLLASVVFLVFQVFDVAENTTPRITALNDMQEPARWVLKDVRMAAGYNLESEYPTVYGSLVLSWTDWSDLVLGPVDRSITYTLVGGQLQRSYDPDTTVAGNEVITTVGKYISNVQFSRSGNVVRVDITSSPEGQAASAEMQTYRVSLPALTTMNTSQ